MSHGGGWGCSGVGGTIRRKEEFAEDKFNTLEQSVPLKCVLQPE